MTRAEQVAAALETVCIDNLFTLRVGADGELYAYALPFSPIDNPICHISLDKDHSIEHFTIQPS